MPNDTEKNPPSPVKRIIDILDLNGYRILKAEEDNTASNIPRGTINLQVCPKSFD